MTLTNISGFPELLPKDQIIFNGIVARIKAQCELHGFIPLDTPAVERVATLLSKGNDNEIYGLYRLAGADGSKEKDIALRFDLTVPLVRYVTQHYGKLTFPYRRYHMAPVWRGERPQSGRYRQFYQCDIDIIGDGDLPMLYDAEALSVICKIFRAINVRFVLKISNRALLSGLIKSFGLVEHSIFAVMRIIDKANKISKDAFLSELCNQGIGQADADLLCSLTIRRMNNAEWLQYLSIICHHGEFVAGLAELRDLIHLLTSFGVLNHDIQIDPTLARGLNYYTGTVSEAILLDYPDLGSVCGGGRYANLASGFSDKQLPGVGFSIGISRLIHRLIECGAIIGNQETSAMVLVTAQNPQLIRHYIKIADHLRAHYINTEIYLASKPLATQMRYASKKGFRFVIIAEEAELANQKVILRSLIDGKQEIISIDQAIETIRAASTS